MSNRTGLPFKTRGSIVNVGSLTSHVAIPGLGSYIASKHGNFSLLFTSNPLTQLAVLGMTKSDALDYGKEGIRVNCISPGWIRTKLTEPLHESEAVSSFAVIFM
jgi:NAD(P)-dependent dehydrogenase (short-subunit alcohol dehydrogenase family)